MTRDKKKKKKTHGPAWRQRETGNKREIGKRKRKIRGMQAREKDEPATAHCDNSRPTFSPTFSSLSSHVLSQRWGMKGTNQNRKRRAKAESRGKQTRCPSFRKNQGQLSLFSLLLPPTSSCASKDEERDKTGWKDESFILFSFPFSHSSYSILLAPLPCPQMSLSLAGSSPSFSSSFFPSVTRPLRPINTQ